LCFKVADGAWPGYWGSPPLGAPPAGPVKSPRKKRMSGGNSSQAAVGADQALADLIGHPVGYAIWRVLTERCASGSELAAALSQPRSTVGDQLRRLIASGLVESAGEETKRGMTERFYRASRTSRWLDDDATGELDGDQKRRIALRVVREALADTSAALASERLDRRDDWCVASSRFAVDSRGWEELARVHRGAVAEMERIRDESGERLAATGEQPVRAISSVTLLELGGPD
jgi:Helix-turn-helix domain